MAAAWADLQLGARDSGDNGDQGHCEEMPGSACRDIAPPRAAATMQINGFRNIVITQWVEGEWGGGVLVI